MFTIDDDEEFVRSIEPIVAGVLRLAQPPEVFVVKIDSWFGDKWLGFSNKLVGAVGVHHRATLRVPPFVPARVVDQRWFRLDAGAYVESPTTLQLHIEQTSEHNAARLMSTVCPDAAVVWWSGSSRQNQRACLMAYVPTPEGHTGWYAEFRRTDRWIIANTLCTTARELATYATA